MSDSLYLVLWRGGFVNVATIARRELLSLGLSPAGWVAAAAMIVPVSAFGFLPEFIGRQLGQMDQVFAAFPLVLTLVVPFYTMRLIAAEWREGTLELLLTAPVRDWEVVLGKWLGVVAFYLTSITFTGFYVLLIAAHLGGEAVLDWGAVWAGYAGLILIGGFFIAVGLLASTLSSNSVLGATGALVALLFVLYLNVVSSLTPAPLNALLDYLAAANRYVAFSQGQIVLKDVVYFLAGIVAALLATTRLLAAREL